MSSRDLLGLPQFEERPSRPDLLSRRPSQLLLPRPLGWSSMEILAERANRVILGNPEVVHVVAIAKSGYPLATTILGRLIHRAPTSVGFLSGVNIESMNNSFNVGARLDSAATILVDNSMHTGKTAVAALQILHNEGIRPNLFVKIVDYQDDLEVESNAYVSAMFGIDIMSLYQKTEICQKLGERHTRLHG